MKKNIAIEVSNISKRYRIGKNEINTTLTQKVLSFLYSPISNFSKLRGLTKFKDSDTDIIWAVTDISFDVYKGEVLGIIGSNGAGKSTLLKILAQIANPTSGTISYSGRVASLLEVGTGFHPELTGRENIFLNGTILGMTKKEVKDKLDEIIEFSGISKFIDTPVKRYSSGMRVRLAFSVAAFLEPEILLIDEVLAVGDFDFQQRCLKKMEDIANSSRTILFVSHNMPAIKNLCARSILIEGGKIEMIDDSEKVISKYINQSIKADNFNNYDSYTGNGHCIIKKMELLSDNNIISSAQTGSNIKFRFHYVVKSELFNPSIIIKVKTLQNNVLFHCFSGDSCNQKIKLLDTSMFEIEIEKNPLPQGDYLLELIIKDNKEICCHYQNIGRITVIKGDYFGTGNLNDGLINGENGTLVNHSWNLV